MLKETDRAAIREIAAKYGVKRVLLFGSAADPSREGGDIDLAVEGVPPRRFFDLYAELISRLTKPVDLVDLEEDSLFVRLVRRDGIPIYG
jgi:predicted nucleotidyltransferase